jgi:hypothetical protein
MSIRVPHPARRSIQLVLLSGGLVALLVAGGIWAILASRDRPVRDQASSSEPDEDFGPYSRQAIDDSGFTVANHYVRKVEDPQSLEHIRDCYDRIGYRGIEEHERELAQGNQLPDQELNHLLTIAQLALYEGDYLRAADTLGRARARAATDPERFRTGLPTVVFLQGLAALRRAETENCVESCCEGSCIFPLRLEAVHRKPEGARQAVRFFTEYLRQRPKEMGVRWLLNLAYMTLGEYPDGVPAEELIPTSAFRSKLDIGRFVDRAPQLGLDRFNQAGGAIMDDFDNDGWLDLAVTSWDPAMPMAFYRNRGDGTFEDRSRAAHLEGQLGGLYCVQTDYNNDGWLDIYVCRGAWRGVPLRHSLLRNNKDGTFTDVTREAGLSHPIDGQVAVWADYDNDGLLDLFVGGETTRSRLYHNKGDGTFEEVALQAGVACEGVFCKGANWGDYDGDGYPDLFVSNLRGSDRLFHNNHDGTFTDVASQFGLAEPHEGFACWFFDYDNDGWPDLFVVSYERSLEDNVRSLLGMWHRGNTCRLYRNRGGKGFEDVSAAVGLNLAMCPMGCNFADFDNDGFLDIYLGTGAPLYSLLTPHRMFKNVQGHHFVDISESSGTGHLQKGHAVACGDWDRNGTVDLFEQIGGATPGDRFRNAFFQNPGQGNHWLTVKLAGRRTNRVAIGARIKAVVAEPAPNTFYRHVTSGSSFGANPLQQTVGLGKATVVSQLEVYWPTSQTTQVFHNVPADQAIEITEFEKDYRPLHWSPVASPPAR